MGEEGYEHIGYLEDLYEDYRRRKMVKVRWLHRSQEVSCISIPPHEVMMTPHVQVVSAECVDGLVTVLNPKHYEQCLAIVSQDFSDGIYMCSRQIKNNKVTSFPLCKLRGYSKQTIFSILYSPTSTNNNKNSKRGRTSSCSTHDDDEEEEEEQEEEEEEEDDDDDDDEVEEEEEEEEEEGGGKDKEEETPGLVPNSITGNEVVEEKQPKLKQVVLVSSMDVIDGREPEHEAPAPCFGVGEEIEVLSEDSGLRGCWFRCKILRASKKHLKVVYLDVEHVLGSGNVEEWIRAYRVAPHDKLQMRSSGRLTVRPFPPSPKNEEEASFSIGAAVDAWWCDAWWEGVVVVTNNIPGSNSKSCLRVYFPGENMFRNVEKENLRRSKDWVGNKWVEIKPKPDIVSYLKLLFQNSPTLGGSSADRRRGCNKKSEGRCW